MSFKAWTNSVWLPHTAPYVALMEQSRQNYQCFTENYWCFTP